MYFASLFVVSGEFQKWVLEIQKQVLEIPKVGFGAHGLALQKLVLKISKVCFGTLVYCVLHKTHFQKWLLNNSKMIFENIKSGFWNWFQLVPKVGFETGCGWFRK